MSSPAWTFSTADPAATRRAGQVLAGCASPGLVVGLIGPLGAGKTAFAQGVGRGLQVDEELTSPTFVLLAEYQGRLPLLHADLYRLEAGEAEAIGLEEQLESWPGLVLVEWADRFPELLPLDHLELRVLLGQDQERRLQAQATGPRAARVLAAWRQQVEGR